MVLLQLILILGLTDYAIGQQLNPSVISTGGETYTASGCSLDFVIGEIVTESYTKQGVMLTQGFLQGAGEELAINEHTIGADDIDVYPNPSDDMVYIMCRADDKPIRIEVVDMHGSIVLSVQFNINPMAVSLKQLNPGLYMIRLMFSIHNVIGKKIIKK